MVLEVSESPFMTYPIFIVAWGISIRYGMLLITELGIHSVPCSCHHRRLLKVSSFHRIALRDLLGVRIQDHFVCGSLIDLLLKLFFSLFPGCIILYK